MNQQEGYLKQLAEKWESLTIANDIMFGMVMENDKICLELIQRSLPKLNIKSISRTMPSKHVGGYINAPTVFCNVVSEDGELQTIAVKMQVADRNYLPVQARFYHDQIDRDILTVSSACPDSLDRYPNYVIIFSDFDYYGLGRSKYQFECACLRDPQLKLDDNRHTIIYNAKAKDFHDTAKLGGFLKLMCDQVESGDRFVEQVQAEIKRIREDPEKKNEFMKYELKLLDAKTGGKEQ